MDHELTVQELLEAAKSLETKQEHPWNLISVELFTDGSGSVRLDGETIKSFKDPEEVIGFLLPTQPAAGG
jgi:hypothetical protein